MKSKTCNVYEKVSDGIWEKKDSKQENMPWGDKELKNMMKNNKGENENRKWRRENVSETKVFV